MATKTKAKGGKKAAKKTGGKRNATPKLISCPFTANLTRPHTTESSGKLATKAAEFGGTKEGWTGDVREAFADGTKAADLPEFPVKAFVDPNKGQLSRKAHEAVVDEYNEAVEAGTKTPAMQGRYNPVLVDLIHSMNCLSLRRGSTAKHSRPPKDWDEKANGPWYHEYEDEDGEMIQEASGWFFDKKMPRRCHAERAELLIDDVDTNILTFGNHRFVVGTGTHDGSAIFMVNQTSHGNYRAGDVTRKRMSFAGIPEVRNIVFKIEDKPNNEGGFTVKGKWVDVREMVYMPGQVLTAGYLYDSKGKVLDAKAIRALDEDTKGIRFKALEAPIVGKAVPWEKLWAEIKVADKAAIKKMRERGGRSDEYEAGDVETKAITNIRVNGLRLDPSEAFPFGLRGSQCDMPAFLVATGEGKIEDGCFAMGVVIGARANYPYNVGVHAAKGEDEETPAPKAKAKAKAKAKGKKSSQPSDAAPPVESDTADEKVKADAETVAV